MQVGIIPSSKAIRMAQEEGLDLVEVAPQAKPPVCRVMDYGKYRYEQSKREKDARRKQHTVQLKGIRLTPNIDKHDFNYKLEAARKFIEGGFKVKVSILFRGRSITHKEIGVETLKRFEEGMSDIAKCEEEPKMEGPRNLVVLFSKKQL